MAMIIRILIGWVLSYGMMVVFGMCYDKLMGAIDYVPWGFVAFLLAYNVIAFIASAVGLLRLKNPKHIAISYIVVTIGIFFSDDQIGLFHSTQPTHFLVYLLRHVKVSPEIEYGEL